MKVKLDVKVHNYTRLLTVPLWFCNQLVCWFCFLVKVLPQFGLIDMVIINTSVVLLVHSYLCGWLILATEFGVVMVCLSLSLLVLLLVFLNIQTK